MMRGNVTQQNDVVFRLGHSSGPVPIGLNKTSYKLTTMNCGLTGSLSRVELPLKHDISE